MAASRGSAVAGSAGLGARRPVRQTVDFSLKGPVHVTLDEVPAGRAAGTPGCSVVDLMFPTPSQVSELVFHNYYTAWLTVLVRMLVAAPGPCSSPSDSGQAGAGDTASQLQTQAQVQAQVQVQVQTSGDAAAKTRKESGWVVAVARKVLMTSPHLEMGSHDFVSILATESAVPWTELVAMRLVLRQPSPSWHTFHVEEIHVFAEPPRRLRRPGAAGPPSPGPPWGSQQPATQQPNDQRAAPDAYDSILLLLRHQTQAALRGYDIPIPGSVLTSSAPGSVPSAASSTTISKPPVTPTRAKQPTAYEINSLPPV